jgi:hypothetical protein
LAIFVLLVVAYFTACCAGFIEFQIWGQVRDLVYGSPSAWLMQAIADPMRYAHEHTPRALCVLPSMILAEWLGVEEDIVFSAFAGLCIIFTAIFVSLTYSSVFTRRVVAGDPFILTLFMLLSLFMNGRMCLALCGYSLILWTHLSWLVGEQGFFPLLWKTCLGLFLMTVSSGAFMVGIGLCGVWAVYWVRGIRQSKTRGTTPLEVGFVIMLLVAVYPLTSLLLKKVLVFYDVDEIDQSWRILEHGVLRHVLGGIPADMLIFLLCTTILFLILVFAAWAGTMSKHIVASYFTAIIFLGLCCGFFGDSTLATTFPALVVLGRAALSADMGPKGRSPARHSPGRPPTAQLQH